MTAPPSSIKSKFRGFCSTMITDAFDESSHDSSFDSKGSHEINVRDGVTSFPLSTGVNNSQTVDNNSSICLNNTIKTSVLDISETEMKLRAAGVYFRSPNENIPPLNSKGEFSSLRPPTHPPNKALKGSNSSDREVSDALNSLDITLANYSHDTSSSSSNCSYKSESLSSGVLRAVNNQRTVDDSAAQYTLGTHRVKSELSDRRGRDQTEDLNMKGETIEVNDANDRGNSVVTIGPYSERRRVGILKTDNELYQHSQKKNVGVLKNNFKNASMSSLTRGSSVRDSLREPLNLIEEVIVPESSVSMRAFFPTVEYSSNSQPNNLLKIKTSDKIDGRHHHPGRSGDSDSGHGSGTTSPCGTLTDPPSPPPSPPDARHKSSQKIILKSVSNVSSNAIESIPNTPDKQYISHCSVTCNDHVSVLTCTPPVTDTDTIPETLPPPPPTSNYTTSSSTHPIESSAVNQSSVIDEVTVTNVDEGSAQQHYVVVAIDFGTTYSGYAFSFVDDPSNIHIMKKWEGGDPGVQNQKTPTIVLLTPDRTFHSLGFSARDHYHDLEPKEAARWLYFDKFKMELHDDKSLSRDSVLVSANGETVPALEIFSHALGYFRDHALRELREQAPGAEVTEVSVRWVITVPAIWSHPAKQFMRTAAYMAGLASPERSDQLLIALEPEAAAIYCRKLHKNQLVPTRTPVLRENRSHISSTRPMSTPVSSLGLSPGLSRPSSTYDSYTKGTENNCSVVAVGVDQHSNRGNNVTVSDWLLQDTVYMVVDCGGGTVDITVHQMTDCNTGHLKELHKATGGPFGSVGVDREFEKLLNKIFGVEFMDTFKQLRPAAFVDLMIAFESRKRNASPYRSTPLNIALPFSFIDLYKKTKGKDIESAIRQQEVSKLGVEWSSQGMLRVSQQTMRSLFIDTLSNIQQSIESVVSLLEREASTGNSSALQFMFLVGGFSESELVQQYIRDAFSHRVTVVIPQGMGLAILRGAVEFGLDPTVVTVRRSRLTCGVGVLNRYQEGVHPQDKRVFAAGTDWCADVLDVFVKVDESVAVGDVVSRSYTPATQGQATVVLHLYATTTHNNMHFVSDSGVERVGTLLLDLKDTWRTGPCNGQCPCCSNLCTTTGELDGGHCVSCGRQRREISVHMKFGGTEVKASAVDHLTGKCVRANFDFLSL